MQKEALSALMDGELTSRETAHSLINEMKEDADLRDAWQRYHLIRDTLKGETVKLLDVNIAERVAEQLKDEPIIFNGQQNKLSTRTQPSSKSKIKQIFKPFTTQVIQFGLAASVAFAVIIGVQQLNSPKNGQDFPMTENPTFNTLPIFGDATQVSLGVPSVENKQLSQSQQQLQEQRKRINTMLQDYELQKRLTKTQGEQTKAPTQVGLSVPGTQTLGNEILSTQ